MKTSISGLSYIFISSWFFLDLHCWVINWFEDLPFPHMGHFMCSCVKTHVLLQHKSDNCLVYYKLCFVWEISKANYILESMQTYCQLVLFLPKCYFLLLQLTLVNWTCPHSWNARVPLPVPFGSIHVFGLFCIATRPSLLLPYWNSWKVLMI